jgi:putative transposase
MEVVMATAQHAPTATLPTIWRVSDELWAILEPILADLDPPAPTGRPRIDQRQALDGLIYHLRTGCQWNALPPEFGDDSSVHRTFQRWLELDVLDGIWAYRLEACEDLGGVDWEWQAADGVLGKARKRGA